MTEIPLPEPQRKPAAIDAPGCELFLDRLRAAADRLSCSEPVTHFWDIFADGFRLITVGPGGARAQIRLVTFDEVADEETTDPLLQAEAEAAFELGEE